MGAAGSARRRVLHGAVLAMAGLVASSGTTFACLIRNLVLWPEAYAHNLVALGLAEPGPPTGSEHAGYLAGTSLADMIFPVVLLLLVPVWLWAVVNFAHQAPRSTLTWLILGGVVSVFVWSAWRTWLFAYPVCNSF